MTLSKKEFLSMLDNTNVETTMSGKGKADWDAIFKKLKKVQAPLDIATIQKYYVEGAVTRYRTKCKLEEWWKANKCLRLVSGGKYVYYFRIPKGYVFPEHPEE